MSAPSDVLVACLAVVASEVLAATGWMTLMRRRGATPTAGDTIRAADRPVSANDPHARIGNSHPSRDTDGAALAAETYLHLVFDGTASNERRCSGCDQLGETVGVLLPARVTFPSGATALVRYCEDCLQIAELAVSNPGASYGALALSATFVRVERLIGRHPRGSRRRHLTIMES